MKYNLSIAINGINTLVIFDTNAWLDLYTVPPIALQEIMDVLNEYKEIFWVPNQVYREFQRNEKDKREYIERIFIEARSKSLKELSTFKDRVLQKIHTLKNQNQIQDMTFSYNLESKINEIREIIENGYSPLIETYKDEIKLISDGDIVNKLLTQIYEETQMEDFSIIEKVKICEEGEIRYKYKVSPGYTDESKPSKTEDYFRKYGDLIIWKEILKKVKDTSINTIFVQNEKKQDWLSEKGGNKLAQVLIEEYQDATNGLGNIEVCNFEGFLENYGETMGLGASQLEKIVQRLRFEREVYEYIDEKKGNIANARIWEIFEDTYILDEAISEIGCDTIYGGNYECAENIEIDNIYIDSCECEIFKEYRMLSIIVRFEVTGNADIEEYISREANYAGNVDFIVYGSLQINYSITYDKIERGPQEGFIKDNEDLVFDNLEFFNESEFGLILKDD